MNINTAFASRTLKAADVEDGDMILTIKTVVVETVGQGKDAEDKPHIYFNETDKALVLNKTNAGVIAKLYGNDTDDWTGKQIALYAMDVQYGNEMVPGIRVRTKAPTSSAPAKPAAAASKSPAVVARSTAWQAFVDQTPEFDDAKRKTKWAAALKSDFPTKAERELTLDEWLTFAQHIVKEYDQGFEDFLPI